ncbi:MAG: transposase [Phycisphaerae bacterium]|nr:transposase [Phycisphaerae bacterium]
MYGISIPRLALRDSSHRLNWLSKINHPVLAKQLKMLWIAYDATAKQTRIAKQQLIELRKKYHFIRFWKKLPGIGLILATTVFAYLETPWRFKKKNRLWKYCDVGLQRTTRGTDKKGRPKPARLQLPWAVNRTLKNAVLGDAIRAINGKDNVFKDYYERMVQDGIITGNARHAVARKLLCVIWGIRKTNSRFNERFCQEPNRPTASVLSR